MTWEQYVAGCKSIPKPSEAAEGHVLLRRFGKTLRALLSAGGVVGLVVVHELSGFREYFAAPTR